MAEKVILIAVFRGGTLKQDRLSIIVLGGYYGKLIS